MLSETVTHLVTWPPREQTSPRCPPVSHPVSGLGIKRSSTNPAHPEPKLLRRPLVCHQQERAGLLAPCPHPHWPSPRHSALRESTQPPSHWVCERHHTHPGWPSSRWCSFPSSPTPAGGPSHSSAHQAGSSRGPGLSPACPDKTLGWRQGHLPSTTPPPDDLGAALHFVS